MTNAERTGGGIGEWAPRTAFQMISLNTRSSARSSISRVNRFEASAPQADARFFADRSVFGMRWEYGVRSAVAVNAADIGRAAASNWLIGSRPRISSIVRSIDEVLYIVESTDFRWMYGLIASAT